MSQHNPFAGVPQIDVKTAYEQLQSDEASFVDVREPDEWNEGHIEGITWIPLGQLPMRWKELDPARKWVCVCHLGSRSNYAAAMLRQAGLDASNMAGGMLDWEMKKLPVTGPR